ncbi:zinc metalloproteinase nas-4 [Microplitis demolitor]|uniref:zinc metalloproteinase nas-4 n=1 Tax=Microplitis demolitor TaxID=69319 RepID=UPI000440031C|nr:zinc metalloproteinase nas-4 [Microplitis demolitor]XP_053594077.1 zinc metalloproteinase nas-4 [Microplitis demolitor]
MFAWYVCYLFAGFSIGIIYPTSWAFVWRRDASNTLDSDEPFINLSHLEQTMYGTPSNLTGSKVAEWQEEAGVNPEELGEYAEGDILFPMSVSGRSGLASSASRWPDATIPYMLSPWFKPNQKQLIMEAMEDFHRYTCVRFVPHNGDRDDYIRITAGNTGCWSSVGRIGGRQDVNLQVPGCVMKKGTVIHELMHAVGFIHEQSRYDRDDFVDIQWQNIKPGNHINFQKASKGTTNPFGVGYDYGSVMHYSKAAFSLNGQPTVIPKETNSGIFGGLDEIFFNSKPSLGQREGFSKKDIKKIRNMYQCDGKKTRNARSRYPLPYQINLFDLFW